MASNDGIITSLQNNFLIATASLNDSLFERSVIYICSHDDNGAMGVVVNRPMESISFVDIADSMGVEPLIAKKAPTIFNGGPVDKNRGFVIHTPDYEVKGSRQLGDGIVFSATANIVGDIADGKGPEDLAFCLGYSGWAPGQLEREIAENSWLVLPADADTLFHVAAEEKYNYCTQRMGLSALNFNDEMVGFA